MVDEWRAAGLKTIHLELATYADMRVLRKVLAAVPGAFTSLGMSESEFVAQAAETEATPNAMADLAERLGLYRLCVHADRPVAPSSLPAGAGFASPLFAQTLSIGKWNFVAVAAPYIVAPASTLGLGDTFTAGCLLVVGQKKIASARRDRSKEQPNVS
jgi:ADP-dependent phosphofructokinase/glucokinase